VFSKLLIANRGEIAVRIARTAQRLGIACVAVYSEADRGAAHVEACDEALLLGPAAPAESYLRIDALIEGARRCGAQAIHPGYGFLAENAAFARACTQAGLVFIGPPAEAIERLGSKSAAKALAQSAGVPVVPGYSGEDQHPSVLQREADAMGYPLLIKPVAGGGGKGMRRVADSAQFADTLALSQREAQSSFGDRRVMLERFITPARHIEVQLLADTHGHTLHLFDRDCSLQRRHQKLLEEAPAPHLPGERRAAMASAAVALARAAGYVNAGTVEFLLGPDGAFYFLEVNTRLQVEHGVTELIAGLDLVEWQLRIAAGEALPISQGQLRAHGHAIEVRLCAEDPTRDFLPDVGRIRALLLPQGEGVRIDSGVRAGDEVSPYYDSLLLKLMVHAPTRSEALARLARALAHTAIVGVANNRGLLARLVQEPALAAGEIDTGFIERERDRLLADEPAIPRECWLLASLAARAARANAVTSASPWADSSGWRLNAPALESMSWQLGGQTRTVRLEATAEELRLELDGVTSRARAPRLSAEVLEAELDGIHWRLPCVALPEQRYSLLFQGRDYALELLDPLRQSAVAEASEHSLRSPLPGRVIAVHVEPGAQVERGAALIVIEAMKMQHTITAPSRGTVTVVHYGAGEQVSAGAELLEFEASGEQRSS
jgi:3-methylcrotonyl-CoA carboxylase alpha subunit